MTNALAAVAALTLPDGAAISGSAQRALAFIEGFEITDVSTFELANEELRAIRTKAKALEDKRTAITGPINAALRLVNDLFRGPAEMIAKADVALTAKILAYQAEQKRIADDERRAAEAAVAAERDRLAAEVAERQRVAREQAQAAAAATAAGDAQAAAIALEAAQRAQAEAVAAATSAQIVVAAAASAPAPVKARGVSTVSRVDFAVDDLAKLVMFIATGERDKPLARPELLALVIADSVKLRATVRGLGLACDFPGVRVFDVKTLSARASA